MTLSPLTMSHVANGQYLPGVSQVIKLDMTPDFSESQKQIESELQVLHKVTFYRPTWE